MHTQEEEEEERESLLGGARGLIARLNAAETHWSVATPPEVEEEENGKYLKKEKVFFMI
jgi:hypothetical protein